MRTANLLAALLLGAATPALGQAAIHLTYGFDRNVDGRVADMDGAVSAIVEWDVGSGLALGLGTDHHFEGASPAPADHHGWALFGTASRWFGQGAVQPFLRFAVGAGRAPCTGDVCTDGLYLRGGAGVILALTGPLHLSAEIAAGRVSRPLAGIGLSLRPGR